MLSYGFNLFALLNNAFLFSLAATCFSKSPLQPVVSLLELMPESLQVSLPYILNLLKGFFSLLFKFYFLYLLVEIHTSFALGKLIFFLSRQYFQILDS